MAYFNGYSTEVLESKSRYFVEDYIEELSQLIDEIEEEVYWDNGFADDASIEGDWDTYNSHVRAANAGIEEIKELSSRISEASAILDKKYVEAIHQKLRECPFMDWRDAADYLFIPLTKGVQWSFV